MDHRRMVSDEVRVRWNLRYKRSAWLGSGAGSRGWSAWLKHRLLETLCASNTIRAVVDIGCGDLSWVSPLFGRPIEAYTGLDIADALVDQLRARYPAQIFHVHDITRGPFANDAELLLCFDVLLHCGSVDEFECALRHVCQSTTRWALVSYPSVRERGVTLTALPHDVVRAEREFMAAFSLWDGQDRVPTFSWGDLAAAVARCSPTLTVQPLAAYRAQAIYALWSGEPLRIDAWRDEWSRLTGWRDTDPT